MLKVKGISYQEKKLLVIEQFPDEKGLYQCYSNGFVTITEEERQQLMKNPRTEEFLLVTKEASFKGSLKKYYEELIENAELLKKLTDGKINMYKTGNYSKTALKYLFDLMNEKGICPEPIEDYETKFLLNSGGAFRLSRPYEGPLYKYDARSYFASIYSYEKLYIPVKKGILKTITQSEFNNMKFIASGIYHCRVEKPKDEQLKKLVWINPDNYYTHLELQYFREKGLKIEIIDEENNFLNYPQSYCKAGSTIFGEYAKTLYKIKEEYGCQGAKKLLNHIWGVLCKKNKKVIMFNPETDEPLDDDNPYELTQLDDNLFEVTFLREQKFEYDLARMKPFFLAKCRLTIAKTIEPFVEHVHYSHTDSILSDIPLDLKDERELGNFRYEGYCEDGYVKNANSRSPNSEFVI